MNRALHFLQHPQPFRALKGLRSPATILVQTDGSFIDYKHFRCSRTATILFASSNISLVRTYFDHVSSTESEWCSILDGLSFSLTKGHGSVELENDCLGVIKGLTTRRGPYTDYYDEIHDTIRKMDYVGVRWIPRELNRADRLFRT
jgi:ribonuclease HI